MNNRHIKHVSYSSQIARSRYTIAKFMRSVWLLSTQLSPNHDLSNPTLYYFFGTCANWISLSSLSFHHIYITRLPWPKHTADHNIYMSQIWLSSKAISITLKFKVIGSLASIYDYRNIFQTFPSDIQMN